MDGLKILELWLSKRGKKAFKYSLVVSIVLTILLVSLVGFSVMSIYPEKQTLPETSEEEVSLVPSQYVKYNTSLPYNVSETIYDSQVLFYKVNEEARLDVKSNRREYSVENKTLRYTARDSNEEFWTKERKLRSNKEHNEININISHLEENRQEYERQFGRNIEINAKIIIDLRIFVGNDSKNITLVSNYDRINEESFRLSRVSNTYSVYTGEREYQENGLFGFKNNFFYSVLVLLLMYSFTIVSYYVMKKSNWRKVEQEVMENRYDKYLSKSKNYSAVIFSDEKADKSKLNLKSSLKDLFVLALSSNDCVMKCEEYDVYFLKKNDIIHYYDPHYMERGTKKPFLPFEKENNKGNNNNKFLGDEIPAESINKVLSETDISLFDNNKEDNTNKEDNKDNQQK